MRSVVTFVLLMLAVALRAQPLDSIHVFKAVPGAGYTSASANAWVWRLHREDAPHRTIKGSDIGTVRDALSEYAPVRHTYGPLEDLAHVAMVFSNGRPLAFGVTDDLGRVIDLTSRKEYRISGWEQHLKVRALLAPLLVE